jgi:hypothetical protein
MEASSSGSFSCNLSSGRIGLRDGLLRWRLELCAGLLRQGSRFVSAFSVNSSRSALWGRPAPPVLLLRRRAGGVFVAREEDERARRVSSSAEEWRRGRPDLRAGELLRWGVVAQPPSLSLLHLRRPLQLVILPRLRSLLLLL